MGWEEMLHSFRLLGGVAENVCLQQGPRGRGLFPQDSSKPVLVHVPERLLFAVEDVVFVNGSLRLRPTAKAGVLEKGWFESYANEFSWVGGVQSQIEQLLEGLQALPEPVRQKLAAQFGLTLCQADLSDKLVRSYFIRSRAVSYQGGSVLMPIIELANHGQLAQYGLDRGISLQGHFEDEILVRYGFQDALGLFSGWGFASPEPVALSLPMTVRTSFGDLNIARRPVLGEALESATLGRIRVPEFVFEGERASLSYLTLGMKGRPRIPKGIFYRFFREAGASQADETFDYIRTLNLLQFVSLLESLEGVSGPVAQTLRATAHHQLKALSYCYGARDI